MNYRIKLENTKRTRIIIINISILFLVIALIITGTFAYKTAYATNSDVEGAVLASTYIKGNNIGPVLDYLKDGSQGVTKVDNTGSSTMKVSSTLEISSISDNLKSNSFKYAILSSTDKDFKNCESVGDATYSDCQVVGKGDFSEAESGSTISIMSNDEVTSNSTMYYKLITYIDGTIENNSNLMNNKLEAIWKINDVTVYTFTLSNTCSNGSGGTTTVYQSCDLENNCKIYYKDNGEEMSSTKSAIEIPSCPGYSFNGYYSGTNGTGTIYIDPTGYLNSAVLPTFKSNGTWYTKWIANKYTITYDSNGGSTCSPNTKEVTYDSTYGTLCIPTKTGYDFIGWNAPNNYTVTSNSKVYIPNNHTLTAEWLSKIYTISLNGQEATTLNTTAVYLKYNDGIYKESGASNKITSITKPEKKYTVTLNYNYSDTTNKEIPVTYTFSGYYTNTSGQGEQLIDETGNITSKFTTTKFTNNTTLYAYWTNGTTTLETPTREGYTFDGWYSDSSLSTKVDTNYKPTKDITLYAKWNISSYTLTINPNGGRYNDSTSNTSVTKEYNTLYGLNTPTKTGYTFNDWTLGSNSTGTLMTGITNGTGTTNGFTVTKKTDTDGSSYTKYTVTSSPTVNTWNYIRFPNYTFTAGHTYKITLQLRINTLDGGDLVLRHACVANDYSSTGRVASSVTSSAEGKGFIEYNLIRTYDSTTIASSNGSTNVTINPLFEIYTGNLKDKTVNMDFDIKNVIITDVTDNTYKYNQGYVYRFGNGNNTVTANYNANPLTFNDKTITKTYSTSSQSDTINSASNGTGTYTYSITSGNDNSYFSLSGTTLNIKASTPVGTYKLTVQAKDSNSGATKDATITVTINKATPTITVSPTSLALTMGTNGSFTYTYTGDGTVYCVSSNTTYATCSVNTSTKTVTVTPKSTTSSAITIGLYASAGTNYSALGSSSSPNKKVSVTISGKKYTVTYTKGTGVSAIGKTSDSCTTSGTSSSCTVTAPTITSSTGYGTGKWGTSSTTQGSIAAGSTITLSSNATYYAIATLNTYTLTITKNTGVSTIYYKINGAYSWESTTTSKSVTGVKYGTAVTYYYTASTGYTASTTCTSSSPCTLSSNVTGNLTLSPTATLNTYTLSITKNTGVNTIYYKVNGAYNWASTTTSKSVTGVKQGTSVTYYYTVNSGYTASESCTSSRPCTLSSNVTGNLTLSPTVKQSTYTISKKTVTGGSITVASSAKQGETVSFQVSHSSGFSYAGATVTNSSGATVATLNSGKTSFTMPASNVTINPKWKYLDAVIFNINSDNASGSFVEGKYDIQRQTFTYFSTPRSDGQKYFAEFLAPSGDSRQDYYYNQKINFTHYGGMSSEVYFNGSCAPTSVGNSAYLGLSSSTTSWVNQLSAKAYVDQYATSNSDTIELDTHSYSTSYYIGLEYVNHSNCTRTVDYKNIKLWGSTYS